MKKYILTFIFSFVSLMFVTSCPIYYQGKVIIVNEQMEILENVEFWTMRNSTDSFKGRRNSYYDDENTDTFCYKFYTGGLRMWIEKNEEKNPSNYQYRIKAKGYADLVLNSINFNNCSWSDTNCKDPVLYIVMKTHQFTIIGNKIERIAEYIVEKPLKVKDTFIFNPTIDLAKGTSNASFISQIQTYPNPFTNKIELVLSTKPLKAYQYTIYNIAGQKVKAADVLEQRAIITLDEIKPGAYIFSLKDDLGNLIYQNKIVKRNEM